MNEKFIQYYVDELVGALNNSQLKSIQLSAQVKVLEEIIRESMQKDNEIHRLTDENKKLQSVVDEYNSVKDKLNHFETFQYEVVRLTSIVESLTKELMDKEKQLSTIKHNEVVLDTPALPIIDVQYSDDEWEI